MIDIRIEERRQKFHNSKNGVLNLSNLGLSEIPDWVFEFNVQVVSLHLDGNLLADYSWDQFNFPNLEYLALSNCELNSLPKCIDGNIKLKSLVAKNNQISEWTLQCLPKLSLLDLSQNLLRSVPAGLSSASQLSTINLSGNLVEEVDLSGDFPQSIRLLDLSQNSIFRISGLGGGGRMTDSCTMIFANNPLQEIEIASQPALKNCFLDLRNCNLKQLPIDFGTIVGLISLNLSCNRLEVLPESFGGLSTLSKLDLSKNELRQLPASFSQLQCLSAVLDLSHNQLTSIPDLSTLESVLELWISFNEISALDPVFLPSKLCRLKADHNLLVEMPNMHENGELRDLNCSNCRLQGALSLDCLPAQIERIDLSNNQINHFVTGLSVFLDCSDFQANNNLIESLSWLRGFPNIRTLKLNWNSISEYGGLTMRLTSLERFELSGNKLELWPAILTELHSLHDLVLSNNNIQEFNLSDPSLAGVYRIWLQGNPLHALVGIPYHKLEFVCVDIGVEVPSSQHKRLVRLSMVDWSDKEWFDFPLQNKEKVEMLWTDGGRVRVGDESIEWMELGKVQWQFPIDGFVGLANSKNGLHLSFENGDYVILPQPKEDPNRTISGLDELCHKFKLRALILETYRGLDDLWA